jgi:hypothetical protein
MARRFEIHGEITRQYRRFNVAGPQLTVRLLPPSDEGDTEPVSHFLASVNDLFEHALQNVSDGDMVGVTIHNKANKKDRHIGLSFHKEVSVIWRCDLERL